MLHPAADCGTQPVAHPVGRSFSKVEILRNARCFYNNVSRSHLLLSIT